MSQRPLHQLARDYVAAWNNHDIEELVSFFRQDAVYDDLGVGTVAPGKQEIRQHFADIFAAFPDATMKLASEPAVTGDRVLSEWVLWGTQKGAFAGVSPTGRRV